LLPGFSLIALQGGFWFDVFTNVFAGAVWAVIAWLTWKTIRIIQHLFRVSRAYYRINGTWIGPCNLPRHSGDVEGIEIYHLNKRKENVTFSFFHYRPDTPKITRYEGAGVYRGEMLSGFYYVAESESSESGVLVLHKVGEMFKGGYAQYLPSGGMKLYQSSECFILRRIQISFWAQVKMLLHSPPFPSYAQAKKLYDAALTEQPDIEVVKA
jgi:hypothetical protein